MTQQIINIGATPNDGQGDTLRVAFNKVNDNFTEVYNLASDPAAGPDGAVQFRATNNLRTIAYSAGVWVSFGTPARFYISTDGYSFERKDYPISSAIVINHAISISTVAEDSRFVAVGSGGTVITSTDGGATWVIRTTGSTANLNSVSFDPVRNQYVVVGDNGVILTSTNLTTWVPQASGVTTNLHSITYNSAIIGYIVVGDGGTILSSLDGTGWETQTASTSINLRGATSTSQYYVITGDNGFISTSVNGVIWVNQISGTDQALTGVASGVTGNLQTTLYTTGSNHIALTSNNGANWTAVTVGANTDFNSVVYDNGFFYTVGSNGVITYTSNTSSWAGTRGVANTFSGDATFVYDDIANTLIVNSIDASTGNVTANVVIANAVSASTIAVSGISNLGNVGNVTIAGGTNGYVLSTDGAGNLNWIPGAAILANITLVNTVNTPNTYVTATQQVTNYISVNSTANFTLNMPVAFTGTVFGGIPGNTTVYIASINTSSNQVTVANTIGGPALTMSTANGNCYMQFVDTRITTSQQNALTEGIKVTITDIIGANVGNNYPLNGNAYFAKVHTSTDFSIFYDADLKTPVNSILFPEYQGFGRVTALTAVDAAGVSKIIAGNNITISPTDGTGVVTISSTGGGGNTNVVSIPAIYFTAPVNGNNQTFSNGFLTSYVSSDDLTVFLNGALLENGFYTLSGSTLTITTDLSAGDSIDIIRQFAANVIQPGGNGVPGGYNTELQYNNNGTFGGIATVTYDGSNITLGDLSNVKITGGINGQTIITDGVGNLSWANASTGDYGNSNVKSYLESGFDGNIIPIGNNIYNLGSPTNQWKDLYLSGNTLYLNGTPVTIENNSLVVGGKLVLTADTPIEGDIEISGNVVALDATFSGNVIAGEVTAGNIQLGGTLTATDGVFTNLTSINSNLGNVANLTILGGNLNQILSTDGTGNLQWIDRTSGTGPSGPVKSVQFNDGAGNFGGSSFLTYDSANTTLNVAGDLLANTLSIGTGVFSFSKSFIHSAVTNSTLPDQEIYSIDAATTSGMDFVIISTDEASSSRQTTRFSVIHYNANISFTETTTMVINNYLGNWNISYNTGSVIKDPQIVLTFTSETSNVIVHRMMITTYEP